ncbi:MAG: type II secretion system protein GspN [Bdellovibrionales bacterium]|jgi:type II secretion system protein N|nr:type II secretion system protein GspN [Bdellovibrionales bacterium]
MNALKSLVQFLLTHKWKLLVIPLIALIWVPILFPYSDLRSVVATTLSRTIGGGTAIDFERISLTWGFPIALELEGFEFETQGVPPISADRLIAKPSLKSIVTQSPSGSIEIDGLFHSQLHASVSGGAKLPGGGTKQDIQAQISGLQLTALTEALRRTGKMGFNIQGVLDTNATASIDPTFSDQPTADVHIQGKTIAIPSIAIPIPGMGPVQTPSLQMAKLEFKGVLNEGKLQIEDFTFGQSTDTLSGRVRGDFGLTVRRDARGVSAVPTSYDLRVEINVAKPLMDAMVKSGAALAFMLIDNDRFKRTVGETIRFSFRAQGQNMFSPPQLTPLTNQ